MIVLKCKMCGGDLAFAEGASTAECEYCGSLQTIPKVDDEKKLVQFERAERLRKQCEFDKAAGIYETIVADFRQEAEAYWGLVLCKYGIEYVDDPATGKKIPTCHRSSFASIMEDSDFEQALENADVVARKVYREEAKQIEEIRKGIISVSSNEQPYDIFICYKETDENGDRTLDSVLAQDVYDALTDKGYRVFFSRITLEEKLGVEYEPYIFAALNSAKVMLAFGTDYEYFNAVWVKNEWSRFLKLMAKDKEKHLIPCYKGIDAYDMPSEFAKLQAQDMGKVGAMQDLLRGIEKIISRQNEAAKGTVAVQQASPAAPGVDSLLERAFMFLEDGAWSDADAYCEKVLDIDPKNARAYLGKLMAELHCKKQESLKDCEKPFDGSNNYQKAIRFADDALKAALTGYIAHINTRNENARLETAYASARAAMAAATTEKAYKLAAQQFDKLGEYKDAASNAKECYKKAEIARKDVIYREADAKLSGRTLVRTRMITLENALAEFQSIPGWKDADEKAALCQAKIDALKAKAKAECQEQERQKEITRQQKEKQARLRIRIAIAILAGVLVFSIFLIVYYSVIIPNNKYNAAVALMKDGKYTEAIAAFQALDGHKDSYEKVRECNTAILDEKYNDAVALKEDGKYTEAIAMFETIKYHKDSIDQINECNTAILDEKYNDAVALKEDGKYTEAIAVFEVLDGYKDSENKIAECNAALYNKAVALMEEGKHTEAIAVFEVLDGYKDSEDKIAECNAALQEAAYNKAVALMKEGKYTEAITAFESLDGYKDAKAQSLALWDKIAVRETISAGGCYTVGLKADGTVVAVGWNGDGQCDVSDWQDIVAISAGYDHTIGLKPDGTVVAVGDNDFGQCDVSDWQDIVAISAGGHHTVGLKADGTVVAVGDNNDGQCNVSGWKDIVAISAGWQHTVGLKADGTVVAVGDNDDGQCDVSGWTDIVAISAGWSHSVGLKADGTVVAVGDNYYGQCDVSGWTDIVAISAGGHYTVGLKADGTVVAVGANGNYQCDVIFWQDIVAISAGGYHTAGLKADGTVVAVGLKGHLQCDVSGWTNIKVNK